MAPINFEDKMREELEKRRIEPSAQSWEKLSARLDRSGKTGQKSHWWLAIAAVLLLALLAGGIYFRSGNPAAPQVADDATEAPSEKPAENPEFQPDTQITSEENKLPLKQDSENGTAQAGKAQANKSSSEKAETAVASSEEKRGKLKPVSPVALAKVKAEAAVLPKKTKELIVVVADHQTGKSGSAEVTDAEVEALLAGAIQEVHQENSGSEEYRAENLLSEVEADLDHSFRNKVFEMLKEGYLKAKTAVATRNQ